MLPAAVLKSYNLTEHTTSYVHNACAKTFQKQNIDKLKLKEIEKKTELDFDSGKWTSLPPSSFTSRQINYIFVKSVAETMLAILSL